MILNLDDWAGEIDDIVKQLNDYPIQNLEEVMVVRNGDVISIYP